ncbi:hypothetical protein TNCT_100401 [Trichonephila clavata]|uniref:Uncharacterized protein n=1 Tax=Trichonephila clavata TaxID=2740835 RepID=A0A8X6FYY6_TRICU|nr:hypothetical protein TNCT_100401 [Trichonephila clavata]
MDNAQKVESEWICRKVHWSFNSEFLCSWKHCERGLTQLQSRKNIRGNMEQRKQWLPIKSKVSRLRTNAAAFDMLTLFPVYLMGKPQNGIASLRK